MLEQALAAERLAIADCNERSKQAESFGDVGLKGDLENQIADETRHKEEIEHILAGRSPRLSRTEGSLPRRVSLETGDRQLSRLSALPSGCFSRNH
ncbi:MAG: hypothetical protein FJ271_13100 [Planctomycetes bacterium]|nr:hypothetical protein [Planctomycetota bacterium]